jgi:hypothetical protein
VRCFLVAFSICGGVGGTRIAYSFVSVVALFAFYLLVFASSVSARESKACKSTRGRLADAVWGTELPIGKRIRIREKVRVGLER